MAYFFKLSCGTVINLEEIVDFFPGGRETDAKIRYRNGQALTIRYENYEDIGRLSRTLDTMIQEQD